MRRRDYDAPSRGQAPRSGTIPRGALRRQPPPPDGSGWVAGALVVGLALLVVVAVSGVFSSEDAGAVPTDGTHEPSPVAIASPAAVTDAPSTPTATPTRPPTPTPPATATPTLAPTPSPTASPTRRPTPPPTPRPTATARPSPSPRASPAAGQLLILEPRDGDVVAERSIVVRGLAPPGATITRDIPFWFDEHTRADSAGRWSFAIDLLPGDNKLTFRIGDDARTSQTLTIRYDGN